ncbi:unnamed protein product, partial [Oppiella nova]
MQRYNMFYQDSPRLYHYTDIEGAAGIKREGYIRPVPPHGEFEAGIYLNDLDPYLHNRTEILLNNYGPQHMYEMDEGRADFVVVIPSNQIVADFLRTYRYTNRKLFCYTGHIYVGKNQ